VLHFSTTDPRDNSRVAIEAFARFVREHRCDHHLVLAGNRNHSQATKGLVATLGIADRVSYLGFLNDEELLSAYANAWCYLDPSLFEGFGLQIVEAQACGAPVVASNNSSIPEVTPPGALLYSHDDVAGFAQGLTKLLDESFHRDYSQKCRAFAKQFSWERTAKELLERARALVLEEPSNPTTP
jgi:alpha-1,3-rhamnosyl/mannosyltransferase